jgi:hypothetical protein
MKNEWPIKSTIVPHQQIEQAALQPSSATAMEGWQCYSSEVRQSLTFKPKTPNLFFNIKKGIMP